MFQPDMVRRSSGRSACTNAHRSAALPRTALALAIAALSTAAVARDTRPATPSFSHAPAATQAMLAKAKPVTAKHAMVVSDQHFATDAGVQILKQGGNAIDAAVAVGYALAVTQPCCGNIGGGGFMTIHLKNGQNLFLNFREKAPLKAT
ncbi:MAG TPA: gamma-glutamyltransferase, partial [Rhodanobacteraceae bacterium]